MGRMIDVALLPYGPVVRNKTGGAPKETVSSGAPHKAMMQM